MSITRRKFLKSSAATVATLSFWRMQDRGASAAGTPAGPLLASWNSLAALVSAQAAPSKTVALMPRAADYTYMW